MSLLIVASRSGRMELFMQSLMGYVGGRYNPMERYSSKLGEGSEIYTRYIYVRRAENRYDGNDGRIKYIGLRPVAGCCGNHGGKRASPKS